MIKYFYRHKKDGQVLDLSALLFAFMQYAQVLATSLEGQRFAFHQAHQQRQQSINDEIDNPGGAEHHHVVGASIQQLAVAHHFHQRDGVGQRGTLENQHHFVGIGR